MTTANHAITGAFIATVIKQPLLAIPLAFLSHFVCDALPHFQYEFVFGKKRMFYYLIGDGLVALLAAAFLLSQHVAHPVLLAVCGFAAMSPDFMWLHYGVKHGTHDLRSTHGPIARFHDKIQWSATVWGIVPEVIWASLLLGSIVALQ